MGITIAIRLVQYTLPKEEFFNTVKHIAFDNLVDDLIYASHSESIGDVHVINLTDVNHFKDNFELLPPWCICMWSSVSTSKQYCRYCFLDCNAKQRNAPISPDPVFSDSAVDIE